MKKRFVAVLSALVMGSTFALSACGGKEEASAADEFKAAVDGVTLPVTVKSADEINRAYGLHEKLSEDERRSVKEYKTKLDGYSGICNAVISLVYYAGQIGDYTTYGDYNKKIEAAEKAYDALITAAADYKSVQDVVSAKTLIDGAKSVCEGKNVQINDYISAVASVEDYDDGETLYTEWSVKINAADEKYSFISSRDDDVYALPQVKEARLRLNGLKTKQGELLTTAQELSDKVNAAEEKYNEVFGEDSPYFDENVNKAFDAAENAYVTASAFNLTNDALTEQTRAKWSALNGKYTGVRFKTSFERDMSGVEAMLTLPSSVGELEEKLAAVESDYQRIPEADRAAVAAAKELFDSAKAKLPELKEQKSFIDGVNALDLGKMLVLKDIKDGAERASGLWKALSESYGYTSGVTQVDEAKASLDKKLSEIDKISLFVEEIDALPAVDALENTVEVYRHITAATLNYEGLTDSQKKYPIVINANMKFANATAKLDTMKSDMFTDAAWDKEGQAVEKGFNSLAYDEQTGLISGSGAKANYLQILYVVAENMPEHKVNGIVINKEHCGNADASEVLDYMSKNFEYVFTIYDAAGIKAGEIKKDLVFDEANQVPAAEELQKLFPIYHNETEFTYRYGVSIRVKTTATDEKMHCIFRNAEEVKSETASQTAGDGQSETSVMLSPHNLITLESNTRVQFIRNGTDVGGYGKSLNYKYVGAYDLYFYLGDSVNEENLLDWIRVVPETQKVGDYNHVKGAYVRTFLGSSLEELELAEITKTDQEYMADGVQDVTATVLSDSGTDKHKKHGWFMSSKVGYSDAWAQISSIAKLFRKLGHDIPEKSEVTIVAKLKVNAAGKEAGVKDSPFSLPIHVVF